MAWGDVRVIFVHRYSAVGGCNNLRFFLPKRSPVFSHFWEALIFWYFWIKPKVQKVKMGNLLGMSDYTYGQASDLSGLLSTDVPINV